MKKYIIDFLAGVIIVIITILTMNFITLDLRVVTFLASILLGLYSFYRSKNKGHILLSILLLCLPISIAFILGILPEIPNLWTAIPLFILSSYIGFNISKKWLLALGSIVLLTYCFIAVPKLVEANLSKFVDEDSPNLTLKTLSSGLEYNVPSKDKIIVLDFYGTWCKPCIAEMEELQEIKNQYSGNENIEFVLVCTNFAKDTPEKASAFIEKRGLDNFINVFDIENKAHKSFGFSGVPALVIIDKDGKVKFKHEGYNQSENLTKTITEIIDRLVMK